MESPKDPCLFHPIAGIAQLGTAVQPPGYMRHDELDEGLTRRVNLTDLPNETILQILGELAENDLLGFALLSRQMNHLSIPLYLSRRSFGPRLGDQLVLFDYNSREVLRVLNLALFKTPLAHLRYPLDCEKPSDELGRELQRLRGLITNNISSLQDATIDFQNTTPFSYHNISRSPFMSIDFGDATLAYGVTNELQNDLVGLLDAIINSGCNTLRITHSGSQLPAVHKINASIPENLGKNWYSGPKSYIKFLRAPWIVTLKTKVKKNSLETFHLDSPMSFHPHLFQWTIDNLNNSMIRTLSISQQLCTDEDSWASILPCINIPTLTDLSIDSCSIRLHDMIKFLNRHSSLQKLSFGRTFTFCHHAFSSKSIISLGQLRYLLAPVHSLIPFFTHATPRSTPSLSSVTILLRVPHGEHFNLGMLDAPLESIFSRLQSMSEVHFALSFGSIPNAWLFPRVDIGAANRANATGAHTLITHLEVHVKVYNLPFALTTKLTDLLVRFPKLKHLRILTLSKGDPITQVQKNIAIRLMLTSCPQLDSVHFAAGAFDDM